MKQVKILGLAVLAVFALGAIMATAAEAKQGPFYKLCKEKAGGKWQDNECSVPAGKELFEKLRIEAGQTKEIEIHVQKPFLLTAGGRSIECKAQKVKPGAVFTGSTGENASGSKEVVEFEECTVAGNGTPCAIPGKKIATEPIVNVLDFEKPELTVGEGLLVGFAPEKEIEKEKRFTKITFEGTGCELKTTTVNGSVAGEAWEGEKKQVKLGENEKLAESNYVNFPKPAIKKDFVEEKGVKKEVKLKLEAFGVEASLVGTTLVKMVEKNADGTHEHWGIFTK